MKKHSLVLLALLCGFVFTANAQFFQFGLKVQYSSQSIDDLKDNVTTAIDNKSTEFLKNCEGGLMFRINVGRWLTIQPEANLSIGAVWDSVDQNQNFFEQVQWLFDGNVETIHLAIPVLASLHLLKVDNTLDLRVFAGPQFYTTIKGAKDEGIDFKNYSVVFGASVDLINVINVDARMTKNPGNDMFYTVGVGLLF